MAKKLSTHYLLLTTIISAMLLAFIALLVIYRKFVGKRLEALLNTLQDISHGDGDLTSRLPEKGQDEISEIAKAFNTFMANIQQVMLEINGVVSKLSGTSEDLASVTKESNEIIHQQGRQTEEMAIVIHDISSKSKEIHDSTVQASEISDKTNSNAHSTTLIVNQSAHDIQQLSAMLKDSTQDMSKLNEGTDNVGGVIEVIRDIADQTNLLALNAAIEAARAGEQGRGFSVVADEVRTLAARTQKSTREIKDMIEQLQSTARQAKNAMDESQKQAEKSAEKVTDANESLNEIVQSIKQVNDINLQIASAAGGQNQMVDTLEQNISHITTLAEHTAESSGRTSNQSDSVADISESIRTLLKRFKL